MPRAKAAPLTADEVIATLRENSKENTAKIYRRHGACGEIWGVPYAVIRKLQQRLGTNHEVALELWETQAHEPRVVALKAADADAMTRKQIDAWLKSTEDNILRGGVADLVARRKDGPSIARKWIDKKGERVRTAGWGALTSLVLEGRIDVEEAGGLLERIQTTIHEGFNRERYSMNNALIAIGGSMPTLRVTATKAAKAIGKVIVDHGETSCKTPDAGPYMKKMWAHAAKKVKKATKRATGSSPGTRRKASSKRTTSSRA